MIIKKETFVLTKEDSPKDIYVNITAPSDAYEIVITMSYTPEMEDDENLCRKEIEHALFKYRAGTPAEPDEWRKFVPIRNYITLSLDHERSYLGCAHRFNPNQYYKFSKEEKPKGFNAPLSISGNWTAVIHVHEIMSVDCTIDFKVEVNV